MNEHQSWNQNQNLSSYLISIYEPISLELEFFLKYLLDYSEVPNYIFNLNYSQLKSIIFTFFEQEILLREQIREAVSFSISYLSQAISNFHESFYIDANNTTLSKFKFLDYFISKDKKKINFDLSNPSNFQILVLFCSICESSFYTYALENVHAGNSEIMMILQFALSDLSRTWNNSYFQCISAEFWAKLIGIISKSNPDLIISKVKYLLQLPVSHPSSFIALSKTSIVLEFSEKSSKLKSKDFQIMYDLDKLYIMIKSLVVTPPKDDNLALNSLLIFGQNAVVKTCEQNPECANMERFFKFFKLTTRISKDKQYTGPAIEFNAHLVILSTNKKIISNIKQYFIQSIKKKFDDSKITNFGYIFNAMTSIVKSDRCQAPIRQLFFESIFHRFNAYENSQKELKNFLLNAYNIDTDEFMKLRTPSLIEPQFLQFNSDAVFGFVFHIIKHSNPDEIASFIAPYQQAAINYLEEKSKLNNENSNPIIFSSLSLKKSILSRGSLQQALFHFIRDSYPFNPALQKSSYIFRNKLYSNALLFGSNSSLQNSSKQNTNFKELSTTKKKNSTTKNDHNHDYEENQKKSIEETPKFCNQFQECHKSYLAKISKCQKILCKKSTLFDDVLFGFEEGRIQIDHCHDIIAISTLLTSNCPKEALNLINLLYTTTEVATAIIRFIQAMIYISKDFAEPICQQLISLIPQNFMKSYQSRLISIDAASLVLQAISESGANVSPEFIYLCSGLFVTSVFSPSPMIRLRLRLIYSELSKYYQIINSIFFFIKRAFIDQIILSSLNSALKSITSKIDFSAEEPNLNELDFTLSFPEVYCEYSENLYQFYLATLSSQLRNYNGVLRKSVTQALTSIVNNPPKDLYTVYSQQNALTFLVSTAYSLNEIIQFLPLIRKESAEAILSSIHPDVILEMANITIPTNLLTAVNYVLRTYLDKSNPNYKILKNNPEWKNSIFKISSQLFNEPGFDKLTITFFDELHDEYYQIPNGPFSRSSLVLSSNSLSNLIKSLASEIDPEGWIVNTLHNGTPEAVSSILSVFPLPDQNYSEFLSHLSFFENTQLLSRFLYHYYSYHLDSFIEQSIRKPIYFESIASQFSEQIPSSNYTHLNPQEVDFTNITYGRTGTLIAFALYYLVNQNSHTQSCKLAAYKMLHAIGVGACAIKSDFEGAIEFLKNMGNLKTLIQASSNDFIIQLSIKISSVLSNHLQFCSEQFVYQSLQLASACPTVTKFIHPWIRDVCFSTETSIILQGTEKSFRKLTSYLFIKSVLDLPISIDTIQILWLAIDNQITPPQNNEQTISVLLLIFLYILSYHTKEYKSVLVYLFTKTPSSLMMLMSSTLTFNYWYHCHHLQFENELISPKNNSEIIPSENPFNKMKNIESLHNISSVSKQIIKTDILDQSDQKVILNSGLLDYENIVKFVLKIIVSCSSDHYSAILPYKIDILLFLYIYAEENDKLITKCSDFIFNIAPWFFKGEIKFREGMMKLVQESKKEDIENLKLKALAWGLCCGQLKLAMKALIFYQCLILPEESIPWNVGESILCSVTIVSMCLYEKSHNNSIDQQNNSFYRMLHLCDSPDWELERDYINLGLSMVAQSAASSRKIPVQKQVFWVLIGFSKCGTEGYIPIFNTVLQGIVSLLNSGNLSSELISSSDFTGILPLIAEAIFDDKTLAIFEDLIQTISKLGAYKILHEDQKLVSLIDEIFSTKKFEKHVPSLLTKLPDDEQDILFKIFTQYLVIYSNETQPQYQQENYIKTTSTFANTLIRYCSVFLNQPKAIFSVVTLSMFAKAALQFNAPNFLFKQIVLMGGGIIHSPHFLKAKRIPLFPDIEKEISNFFKLTKKLKDNLSSFQTLTSDGFDFNKVAEFPPLLILDPGLMQCPTTEKIRNIVERYKVLPFSQWSELLFRAECYTIAKYGFTDTLNSNDAYLKDRFFDDVTNTMNTASFYNEDNYKDKSKNDTTLHQMEANSKNNESSLFSFVPSVNEL